MSSPRMLSNRYELGDTLGYGGMSEVHRGRDVRLGRDVAVKVLRADLARDPQFQERFRREAQNAAALNHPAIVAVYDTGEAQTEFGRLPYIVMEYVDGRTLRDIVKTEGPVSEKRSMEIMADVSAALDFSHRHGIVHRDVKPANVMITQTGAVKVMDFGIARAVHDGQAAVTQTAAVIGTAQYLSPEQARGEQVDARSDVYSAGCVLYELLTGEPPFTGDSPVAVAYQHVREDPHPPSSVHRQVSPALDAIVLKALAKNPLNRYQSAAELRSDLVRVLAGQRPQAPSVMTDDDRTSIMAGGAGAAPDDDYYDDDYYDEEDERRERRRKMWRTAGLVALVVALLGGAAILANALFGSSDDGKVEVPDLANKTQNEARQELQTANLTPAFQLVPCGPRKNQPQECSEDQIRKVLSSDPGAGERVERNSEVRVKIGAPAEDVQVPKLIGLDKADAEKKLDDAGLNLNPTVTTRETSDESQVGKVLGQNPAPGMKIKPGESVQIQVGKKKPTVTLGDYTGQQYDQAASNIDQLGLDVSRKDVESTEPKGTVISQYPESGEVDPDTTVQLNVSKGEETLDMPDVTGQRPDEAEATLRQMGWKGSATSQEVSTTDPTQIGQVLASDPAAGGKLEPDQDVVFQVGAPGIPGNNGNPQSGNRGGGGAHEGVLPRRGN